MFQDPGIPNAADIRSEAARILDSADFAFRAKKDLGVGTWLKQKLNAMMDWFGSLYTDSPVLYWLIMVGCLIILAAIFAHAGVVLSRAFKASRGRGRAPGPARDRRSPAALLADARAAVARGDVTAALTLYLRAATLGLDLRGLVRATETATVREYLGLLGRHPAEKGLFQRFLAHYEPGVFGRRSLPKGSIDDCDVIARRLAGEGA